MSLALALDPTSLGALDELAESTDRDGRVAEAIADFLAHSAWQFAKLGSGLAAGERGDLASDDGVARARSKFAAAN